MHFWSKFGNPDYDWWLMARTHSQAQTGANFDFEVKFYLEGQIQPTPKIRILTKVVYTYGPNLMILAWTGNELSRGQSCDGRTDGQTQATPIPEGHNWPRVKMADDVSRNLIAHRQCNWHNLGIRLARGKTCGANNNFLIATKQMPPILRHNHKKHI